MSFIGRATALATHPGYVPGNWYNPFVGYAGGAGALPGNSIRLLPFTITKPIKVAQLAAKVSVVSAGGNFQLAIYANNPLTGRPTGAALCSTGNMSTAAGGMVSAAVGAATTLPAGTYWAAVNTDNAVAAFTSLSISFNWMGAIVGTPTLGLLSNGGGAFNLFLTVAQAFGAWPDLTAGAFVEAAGADSNAIVFIKAG